MSQPDHRRLADGLKRIRTRPRPGMPKGLSGAEATRRTGLWGDEPITPSYWAQVERGDSAPTAPVLLRMALACDASGGEIHELFHSAGYGPLFDTLAGLGHSAQTVPKVSDAAIVADPRLPYEKRLSILEHLHDALDAQAGRLRRAAEEAIERGAKAPHEDEGPGGGPSSQG